MRSPRRCVFRVRSSDETNNHAASRLPISSRGYREVFRDHVDLVQPQITARDISRVLRPGNCRSTDSEKLLVPCAGLNEGGKYLLVLSCILESSSSSISISEGNSSS